MRATYRFRARPSYARRIVATSFLASLVGLGLSGCSEDRPIQPRSVIIAERLPADWPAPRAALQGPQIQAMRFSTLDVALGASWDGDAIASPDTTQIDVKTNLFDFTMPRTAPGRFRFALHMLDLPAFLVRPYTLHVVARDAAGRESTLLVPFRIHGRLR